MSFVKASDSSVYKKAANKLSQNDSYKWQVEQAALGRYVIQDEHFAIGGHIRSVPKLGDPNNSALLKRRMESMH